MPGLLPGHLLFLHLAICLFIHLLAGCLSGGSVHTTEGFLHICLVKNAVMLLLVAKIVPLARESDNPHRGLA